MTANEVIKPMLDDMIASKALADLETYASQHGNKKWARLISIIKDRHAIPISNRANKLNYYQLKELQEAYDKWQTLSNFG